MANLLPKMWLVEAVGLKFTMWHWLEYSCCCEKPWPLKLISSYWKRRKWLAQKSLRHALSVTDMTMTCLLATAFTIWLLLVLVMVLRSFEQISLQDSIFIIAQIHPLVGNLEQECMTHSQLVGSCFHQWRGTFVKQRGEVHIVSRIQLSCATD